MTWTYDVTKLATSELYQVRLEVQDTDTNNQLLADEEINQAIAVERNFWNAAARCAEIISMSFAKKADVRLGRSLFVLYTKMAEQYRERAKELRKKATSTQVPWVGGMTLADKLNYEQDTTLVQPVFAKTMQANPWAGGYTSDVDDSQSNNVDQNS